MTAPPISAPVPLQSPRLLAAGFRHGFFTRLGGVSLPPFDSLNFTTDERPEHRSENLRRVAASLGVDAAHVYMPRQVHGTVVLTVDERSSAADVLALEADAVLSASSRVACAIRTADCVSVLLGCVETGLAAASHAGWKGCVRGVLPATVRALQDAGAKRLVAAIGPHISLAAFEVEEDVAQELLAASPDPDIVDRSGPKPHVDLRKMARAQLARAGLHHDDIDDVLGCTVLEPERFYSFRRDGEQSGRLLTAIVPR